MKILIIRFSSIGDIVLTSPVVRCIKKQIPSSEIHYLTKKSFKGIIEHNPHIDVKHYLDDNWKEVINSLKKENFSFIADLHNNFRSWQVRMSLRKRYNAVNKLNFEKWLLVNMKWNILPPVHLVDRYLETVRDIGIKNDGKGLDYFITPQDEILPEELPLSHLHGFIAIAIGGHHETKKLPEGKLRNLVRNLPFPIIILGGSEDQLTGESIRGEDPVKIFNACGKYSLNQSASIIRQSRMVITHDTGLMHIAAAFKKKIISIWGNTVPEFGMYPYFGSGNENQLASLSRMIEITGLNCRPCSKIGYQKCPQGHFKCMKQIDEQAVSEMVGHF